MYHCTIDKIQRYMLICVYVKALIDSFVQGCFMNFYIVNFCLPYNYYSSIFNLSLDVDIKLTPNTLSSISTSKGRHVRESGLEHVRICV